MTVLFLWFASSATAAPLEVIYLEKLKAARSPAAVTSVHQDFEAIRLQKLICEAQIEQGLAPSACYSALNKLIAWHAVSSEAAAVRLNDLDRACRAAARATLKQPSTPVFESQNGADLSPECRKATKNARDAVQYRGGRSHGPNLEDADDP